MWISEVLDRLHRYRPWSRALTASMLANVGMEAAPAMRAYLDDDRNATQARAAVTQALEILRDAEAADVAAAQLRDADSELVAACLRLLTVVGRGVHADAVRPLLSDDRFFIRAAAIVALGKLGSKEDVDAIVAAVDDSSPWVPIRSAHALADLHAPDALARLTAMGGVPAAAAIETLYEGVT